MVGSVGLTSDPVDLTNARVVLFDPVRANMLVSRTILHGAGFRSIDGILDREHLLRRLDDTETGLLMIDAEENRREMVELARRIRRGDLGGNPFLAMVATLWNANSDAVSELMNAGFDDVLIRPFSVARAQQRVRSLIFARKKFVVTSDYIGPDRGLSGPEQDTTELIEVPNTLRASVNGDSNDLVSMSAQLNEARESLQRQRLAKLARRIAIATEVTIQATEDGSKETGFILDLLDSAERLVTAARHSGNEEVLDIANVLEGVAHRVATPGPDRIENAQLTRQLALALYAAYDTQQQEEFSRQLDATLDLVRDRLDGARARVQRRAALQRMLG